MSPLLIQAASGGVEGAAAFFAERSVREALFQAASLSGSGLYLFWMAASRRVTMACAWLRRVSMAEVLSTPSRLSLCLPVLQASRASRSARRSSTKSAGSS
jgi:hypothetical protein